MAPTKVTALCGFLGAGKTTTLSYLLSNCQQGVRIGVIANDVAKVNIDAKIVQQITKDEGGRMVSVQLDNGCACCTGSDDLVAGVESLMNQNGDGPAFDHIVIEATGVAEAGQMRAVLGEAPSIKSGRASAPTVVTVIDSNDFLAQYESADKLSERPDLAGERAAEQRRLVVDLLVEQVEAADAILLNKADLLQERPERLKALHSIAQALNPEALKRETAHGVVDLLSFVEESARSRAKPAQAHGHNAAADATGTGQGQHHKCTHKCDEGDSCSHGTKHKLADHKERFGIDSFVFSSDRPFHGPALAQKVLKQMAAAQQSASLEALEALEAEMIVDDEAKRPSSAEAGDENPFGRVLRSKGFIFLGGPQSHRKMYWSHAGRHFGVIPQGEWDEVTPKQELVFIGVDMDRERILGLLNEALAP